MGGYCQIGAREKEYKYRVAPETGKGGVIVEVVEHPRDYAHVAHDLVGALRLAANGGPFPGLPPHEDSIEGIELIDWRCRHALESQSIALATNAANQKGGVVAWHTNSMDTNGLVTVVMRFTNLEGIPKQLLDEFLTQYPSAVDKSTFIPADWVDDDLKKWAQILREEHDSKVILDIAARNLWQYEREAWQKAKDEGLEWEPWDAMDIANKPIGSHEIKESAHVLTERIERRRLDRKREN